VNGSQHDLASSHSRSPLISAQEIAPTSENAAKHQCRFAMLPDPSARLGSAGEV
jgi:hypothetical protein